MRIDKRPLCLLSGTCSKRISTNNASADKFIGDGLDVDVVDVIAMAVKQCGTVQSHLGHCCSEARFQSSQSRERPLCRTSRHGYSVRRSRIRVS